MLDHLIAAMAEPDNHVYAWRHGELYIRATGDEDGAGTGTSSRENRKDRRINAGARRLPSGRKFLRRTVAALSAASDRLRLTL